ncbi:MAG: hypothetical protein KAV87_68600 [Desulfobacteraceae bacterium]|nr:hypothetical protein [Desulfobacteraceae bacterium]
MLKMIGRIKKLFGSKKIVIYRKETGVHDKVNSNLPNTDSIKHVIYNNSFELSAEDLIAIKSIFKKSSKKILRRLDRPNYRLFAIKLNGVMAHFCLVVICREGDFFGMAHKDDLIIMNCNTLEKYRRKGLYKANLQYICSNWQFSKWAYINTRPENIFSQKGVESAGFERMGVYKYFQIARFNIHVRKCGD